MALTLAVYVAPPGWEKPTAMAAVLALAGVNYVGVTRTAAAARIIVVAVLSALFAALLGVLAVRLWRGRRLGLNGVGALSYSVRSHSATATAAATLTVAAAVLVLCVANISSALEPGRALSLFFAGG